MTQVMSGRVVFSRTIQPANYESARAEVEMAFVLAEGEDPGEAVREVGESCRRAALDILDRDLPARRRPFRARTDADE